MRTLCDACEAAAAVVFCAADEAALCHSCDEKVHMCNKLASRHVRVGLATPSDVPRCDICENAPAFFYCEIDGTSLCLQCDMIVHVGGKRTHGRYLLLRQRVEFPGDKSGSDDQALVLVDRSDAKRGQNQVPKLSMGENHQNHRSPVGQVSDSGADGEIKMEDSKLIDLNMKPHRTHEQASYNERGSFEAIREVPSKLLSSTVRSLKRPTAFDLGIRRTYSFDPAEQTIFGRRNFCTTMH